MTYSKPTVILFSGRMQAGKDTCADHLVNKLGATKYSYADYLKQMCCRLFNIEVQDIYGSNDRKNKLTCVEWKNLPSLPEELWNNRLDDIYLSIRELLKYLGTHVFRKMHYDCWVNATLNLILDDLPEIAVIADCRFPNEIENFKNESLIDLGIFDKVISIRLTRQINNDSDPSETSLDDYKFDYVIDNSEMTIEEQLQEVDKIINEIY